MALCRAMLRIPRASVITKIIGKPSGTIATNIAMATMNCSTATSRSSTVLIAGSAYAISTLIETISAATINAMKPKNRPSDSSLSSRGVFGVSVSTMLLAMRPSSVFIPVSTTTPMARPVETHVPMYAMLFLSARRVFSGSGSEDLRMLSDSPVREDSSILH